MKKLTTILACMAVVSILSVAKTAWARDELAGKWSVHMSSDSGGAKEMDDTLTFSNDGKLTSEQFKKKGFDACTIDEDTRGLQIMSFTANATSEKEGKIKWEGSATGGTIKGTLTWTKKDGSVVTYSYNGEKK